MTFTGKPLAGPTEAGKDAAKSMMHSSPMPLTVALDMTKRLHHELAHHMTPEQKRDMMRVERLIQEAHEQHQMQLLRMQQQAQAKAQSSAKKSIWGRR